MVAPAVPVCRNDRRSADFHAEGRRHRQRHANLPSNTQENDALRSRHALGRQSKASECNGQFLSGHRCRRLLANLLGPGGQHQHQRNRRSQKRRKFGLGLEMHPPCHHSGQGSRRGVAARTRGSVRTIRKVSGFVFPFDAYAERLFFVTCAGSYVLCLVHDVDGTAQGVLMAHAFEHDFGPVWLSQERVWWIDPAHRGSAAPRMLDAYEAWARTNGCRFAGMAGMGDDPAVMKLYQRRGYRVAETHCLKPLAQIAVAA